MRVAPLKKNKSKNRKKTCHYVLCLARACLMLSSMKSDIATKKTKSATAKLTPAQHKVVDERARAQGKDVSEHLRHLLFSDLEGAKSHEQISLVLGEVLALRAIVLNLLFLLSKGEPLTADTMRELVERVDNDKMQRALERLSDARSTARLTTGATATTKGKSDE